MHNTHLDSVSALTPLLLEQVMYMTRTIRYIRVPCCACHIFQKPLSFPALAPIMLSMLSYKPSLLQYNTFLSQAQKVCKALDIQMTALIMLTAHSSQLTAHSVNAL